ncbi:MAG: ABC transporter ATP-binding protein [Acidobacteriota bacterium]|nr:ABC transporter ATP-binding protein [Acidobacteriota bacterium]
MIDARDLRVSFRRGRFGRAKLHALDGFSLAVAAGEVVAILGPNGCGKSTAMHTMLGLIQPEDGSVRLMGERPIPGSAMYDRIAYLPEEPHYHLYLTVGEAVRYYAGLHRRPVPLKKIAGAIAAVGLEADTDLLLRKCSKGMKQKVGIAACLAVEPDLLFLDEPMRGLDPESVRSFRDELKRMNRGGATIVLNSHILAEVEMIATRAVIVRKGKVLRQGPIEALRAAQPDRYAVKLALEEQPPDYLSVSERRDGAILGTLPAARVRDLFDFVEASGGKVISAELAKRSLEDAFLATLEEGAGGG